MYLNDKLLIGKKTTGEEANLLLNYSNRHGLITGASGSGKTITLKVLAESFASAGVPIFLCDVKGDLAGTSKMGTINEKIQERIDNLHLENFAPTQFGVTFYDMYGKNGHPIRVSIKSLGSKLLAKMLNLTDAQEGCLNIVFKIAEDEQLEIIDLNDFRSILNYVGEKRKEYTLKYGNVNLQSLGSIQRNILELENEGGDIFFGKPEFDLYDLIKFDPNTGRGMINILDSQELFQKPTLYATFLLWLLSNLYNTMPEVGDLPKPKLVLFFDEAHLLFNEMPEHLTKQIIQIVKLIRSKGIGLYFISQSPADIPDDILAQLGNRIQHVLRSYTPKDDKAIKSAADSYRTNPEFNTMEAIKTLATGEALISFLNEKAEPSIVDKYTILPPQSMMGTITDEERKTIIASSSIYGKYENAVDEISASEKISNIKQQEQIQLEQEQQRLELEKKNAELNKNLMKTSTTKTTTTTKKKTPTVNKKEDRLTNKAIDSLGRKIGNAIFKGLFK